MIFATPLYFYGMSAQLKKVIDRFCSFNADIKHKHMKSVLLTVAADSKNWTFDALESHYKTVVKYLNLGDWGTVLGKGCGDPSMTKKSSYPSEAYSLGKSM